MPVPLRVTPTGATRTELGGRCTAARDAETRLRSQMVLLAADGAATTAV